MSSCGTNTQYNYTFDTNLKCSSKLFRLKLNALLNENLQNNQDIVIVCIGSDRSTGDSLAPLVGSFLSKKKYRNVYIYGTLKNTVHAKNLVDTLDDIKVRHKNAFVISIDASLGRESRVGYVTTGLGSLQPGSGVDKDLPEVGDMYIAGIVNISGKMNYLLLQTTKLSIVMQLAEFIANGLDYAIKRR